METLFLSKQVRLSVLAQFNRTAALLAALGVVCCASSRLSAQTTETAPAMADTGTSPPATEAPDNSNSVTAPNAEPAPLAAVTEEQTTGGPALAAEPSTTSGVFLPNQWTLRPAGESIPLGDFPVNMVLSPDEKYA